MHREKGKATCRIRTGDLCFTKAREATATDDDTGAYASHLVARGSGRSSPPIAGPSDALRPDAISPAEAAMIAEALSRLSADERQAVVEHIVALAGMPPARRAAVITLARGD